jgi:predicted ATPase
MGLVNLEYSFARGGSVSRNYRPTNVGFGITFILPVLVAVLSAQPGTLLLVENPEAHLHPKGQSMLAQLIAKAAASGVQVIVESHSDHFLNGLRIAVRQKIISPDHLSANFFQFDPNSKSSKITKIGIDENGRVDNWPEDFFDEWEKSLEKLM